MMRVCQSLIASQALADYSSLNTIAIVRLLAAQIAENVRHMLRVECCAIGPRSPYGDKRH
jgi:hypothetical protein